MGWGIPFGIYSQDAKQDPTAAATGILGKNTAEQAQQALTGMGTVNGVYSNLTPEDRLRDLPGGYTGQELAAAGLHSSALAGINPLMNKQLQQATQLSGQAASGALGQQVGGADAARVNYGAAQSAQAIGGAGMDTRAQALGAAGSAMGQNQQMGSDLNVVRNTANGVGPSAAENLARAQLNQTQAAMAGQAASARGGNIASAMRSAQLAGGQMGLQAAPQLQAQRAAEQLNAQGIMTQGNAALGTNINNTAGVYGGQRLQDVNQATAVAGGMGDAAKVASANFGTQAGLAGQGVSGMQSAAGLQQTAAVQQQTAEQNARQQYIDFLQKQYSLGSGLPVGFAGPQAQIAIANQNAQQQTNGASSAALGAILAAAI